MLSECIVLFVVATQENRQADYTCQTENNVPGNQQAVVLPPCPPPFWSPEGGWWGYYPLPYSNDSYPCHPDNTAYVYFPIYNQNFSGYPPFNPANDKNQHPYPYPPSYVIPVPPQTNNCSYGQATAAVANPEPAVISQENKINEPNVSNGDQNQWDRANSMSRTASSDSRGSDCTTAMNITDEEEIPEPMATVAQENASDTLEGNKCVNSSLNVTVPNYTYIDTSDSSDSTDSEFQMDNESIIESSKSCSDRNVEDTSSDTDDSDSYLAYSTGLNPHGRFEKDQERSNARIDSVESQNDEQRSEALVEGSVDLVDEQQRNGRSKNEEDKVDATFPHKLSVIYEDVEQVEVEGSKSQEVNDVRIWNGTPFEATDDPPDDVDDTTVSVSLPLRFKFSVSENNEDVTTVIVGDSTIKPERSSGKDEGKSPRSQEQKNQERSNEDRKSVV